MCGRYPHPSDPDSIIACSIQYSIDDTIDVVTEDGFFVRIKPFIVTRSSVKASQKHESRSVTRNEVVKFCAQSTWINVQKALMDGSLEETVSKAISKIQPVRAVFFRRSQLIQDGVVVDDGPTLEEIKADEKSAREQEEATPDEEGISDDSSDEDVSVEEQPDEPDDDDQEDGDSDDVDYDSMTVAQLKELLKEAGKPVSGKKADLISRLSE